MKYREILEAVKNKDEKIFKFYNIITPMGLKPGEYSQHIDSKDFKFTSSFNNVDVPDAIDITCLFAISLRNMLTEDDDFYNADFPEGSTVFIMSKDFIFNFNIKKFIYSRQPKTMAFDVVGTLRPKREYADDITVEIDNMSFNVYGAWISRMNFNEENEKFETELVYDYVENCFNPEMNIIKH